MLTNGQKAYLARLARRAFAAHPPAVGGPRDGIGLDEWRREEVAKACGKLGLRCCGQDDYKLVEGYFLNLLGHPERALRSYVRAATQPVRQAKNVLFWTLKRYGYEQNYAEKICRVKYKCTVSEASANQVWTLVYDVQRNGQRRQKKLKGELV
jgi:hypothetical protein